MGRKTYESVGRPLPKRTNIIITSDKDYTADGCVIVHSLKEALEVSDDTEQFVVGGEQIYRLALPLADRVYLTRVHATPNGDRFFPELGTEWKQTAEEFHPADETHEHAFTFCTFVKQRN
jgi:dihydrofolate reductase